MSNEKKCRLGDIAKLKKGVQLGKLEMISDGQYPVLNGGISYSGFTDTSNTPRNTITISEGGNSCGYVNYIKEDFWSGGHCYTLEEISKDVDKMFLFFLLKFHQNRIMRLRVGSGLPNIQRESLMNFQLTIPSLFEQKEIVSTIEKWDKNIELLDKKIEVKKNVEKYLYTELLSTASSVKECNTSWSEYKLSDLGSVYSGLKSKNKNDFGNGEKYISYMNIFSNPEIDTNISTYVKIGVGESQNKAKYGDIFFTTSSETPDEVGMSSVLLEEVNNLYLNSFCFGFRLNNFDVLLPEFAKFYFRSSDFRRKINRIAQGAIRYNLSKNYFLEVKISIPPLQEQKEIVRILTQSNKEIELLENKKTLIEQQRKYLINNLVTGNIRLPKFKNNK